MGCCVGLPIALNYCSEIFYKDSSNTGRAIVVASRNLFPTHVARAFKDGLIQDKAWKQAVHVCHIQYVIAPET